MISNYWAIIYSKDSNLNWFLLYQSMVWTRKYPHCNTSTHSLLRDRIIIDCPLIINLIKLSWELMLPRCWTTQTVNSYSTLTIRFKEVNANTAQSPMTAHRLAEFLSLRGNLSQSCMACVNYWGNLINEEVHLNWQNEFYYLTRYEVCWEDLLMVVSLHL